MPRRTQLAGGLDVDVVVAAAYADDDPQGLELLQVLTGQRDCVVHHGSHRLVQHLRGRDHVPSHVIGLAEQKCRRGAT